MNQLAEDLQTVLRESSDHHSKTPHVSFAAYREAKYKLFDRFVEARRLVYLDMNFWISLRDPIEASKPAETTELLDLLRTGVESGRILCPVSYAVFVELMKQKQVGDRRIVLARLMDELSMGVGIRNPFDIARIEYLKFFRQYVPRLAAYIDNAWAPIGHLIHEVYPYQDGLPHDLMEQGRKVMCDMDFARKMEHLAQTDPPAFPRTAAETINAAREIHLRGNKTFAQLFADELIGAVEDVLLYVDEIKSNMADARFDAKEIVLIEQQRPIVVNALRRAASDSANDHAAPVRAQKCAPIATPSGSE